MVKLAVAREITATKSRNVGNSLVIIVRPDISASVTHLANIVVGQPASLKCHPGKGRGRRRRIDVESHLFGSSQRQRDIKFGTATILAIR